MASESKENKAMDCVSGNEIITIGVGQAGLYMLNEYMTTIANEHKIDMKSGTFCGDWNNTTDKMLMLKHNTYFTLKKSNNHYIPRCIFTDCDSSTINKISTSPLGALIDNEHLLQAQDKPCIIWAKGHYTEGAEYIDEIVDVVRHTVEVCDIPQGFQLFHSLCGMIHVIYHIINIYQWLYINYKVDGGVV